MGKFNQVKRRTGKMSNAQQPVPKSCLSVHGALTFGMGHLASSTTPAISMQRDLMHSYKTGDGI
jgi:hypothetical protein